ncbi:MULTISPECIES: hypothetical protein [Bradyrhizobium]|uniref:hypothetical protein n=1 Tax=Bradyrhizobium TaxID=374 RepID=UPI0004851520|nr:MULTISPECIES: hypothetical protein [Bradyrhizobium]UFW46565.1 hypothetical protein BaraCB756_30320 [Bradyrhizobium arachidis]
MSTFVDSSVWFVAACKRYRNNELAKSILLSIDRCMLTDHVLVQTWQLLNAQFGMSAAETFIFSRRRHGSVLFLAPLVLTLACAGFFWISRCMSCIRRLLTT